MPIGKTRQNASRKRMIVHCLFQGRQFVLRKRRHVFQPNGQVNHAYSDRRVFDQNLVISFSQLGQPHSLSRFKDKCQRTCFAQPPDQTFCAPADLARINPARMKPPLEILFERVLVICNQVQHAVHRAQAKRVAFTCDGKLQRSLCRTRKILNNLPEDLNHFEGDIKMKKAVHFARVAQRSDFRCAPTFISRRIEGERFRRMRGAAVGFDRYGDLVLFRRRLWKPQPC